jgi:asparagine synthase (glutamine-hydrolysing)
MFSFVIHDQRFKEKVYIVRDKLGIKPIYYSSINNRINFSSEIKPLAKLIKKKSVDSSFINEYLLFNYPIDPETTIIDSIKLLEPSSYIEISNNNFLKKKYWSIDYGSKNSPISFEDIFDDAIKRHLISDVSIASTLSSGIDSSIVTFKANKFNENIDNYTLSFNNYEIDESEEVRGFTKYHNIKTNYIKYNKELFIKDIDDTIETLEEPRVGIATQNYHLYKMISQDNHKVVLSGLGGDEMFGGYYWRYLVNSNDFNSNYFNLLVKPGELNELLDKKVKISKKDIYQKFNSELNKINQETQLKKCLNFEIKTFLHSLLLVEDKISMKHGIESRVPLLDEKIMEYAFNLKDIDLANQYNGKIFFSNYVNSVCQIKKFNVKKKGFIIPHNQWISRRSSLVSNLTNQDDIFDDYFDRKKLLKFLDDKKNDINFGQYIWKLYSLKKSLKNLEINA